MGGSVDVLNVIGYLEDGNTLFRDYYSLSDGSEDIIAPDGLRDGEMQQQVGNPMDNVIESPIPASPKKSPRISPSFIRVIVTIYRLSPVRGRR